MNRIFRSTTAPRVAFFTDTYDEINGVALTSRRLEAFARSQGYPFLCIRGGKSDSHRSDDSLLLERSQFSATLDHGLRHDLFLWRHYTRVRRAIRAFRPDVIHIVSPGDVSEIGLAIATAEKIPLAISWHTNLHEFGEMRLRKLLGWMPRPMRDGVCWMSQQAMLSVLVQFYRMGDILFAPNQELIDMLRERTGRPTLLMSRGVDTQVFHPSKRRVADSVFRIGFVGRITPEKNVRFFATLEQALLARGIRDFQFVIVGAGSERNWLQANMKHVELPGILRGEDLAAAYANMDLFVFPSRTDTFGNVVQEAMASGVPAIVTDGGGPRFIVRDGVSGCVTHSEQEMVTCAIDLMFNRERLDEMRRASLRQMRSVSWEQVFHDMYAAYEGILGTSPHTDDAQFGRHDTDRVFSER